MDGVLMQILFLMKVGWCSNHWTSARNLKMALMQIFGWTCSSSNCRRNFSALPHVSKKYNFDNLSQSDIQELIEDKLQKNIDKVLHNWEDEGILVEKARWGRSVITKGKIKIELSKDVDATKLTLAEVQEMIAKKTPAKKVAAKKTTAAKKPAVKKAVAKKK
jgi:hypothetical protein